MFISKYIGPIAALALFCQTAAGQINSPNLIQDETIQISGITTDAQIYALTTAQKMTVHRWYDGLGRPLQTALVGASPSQKDIIRYNSYNSLGQQTYSYLPYVAADGSGVFHTAAATEQTTYYSNGLPNKVVEDTKPWSQNIPESSPLQRILSIGMNGDGFQPTQHYKSVNYRGNNTAVYTNDSYNAGIRQWNYDGTSAGYYATGSLSVTELTDESNNVTVEYTDANNKVVLKRQIITPQVIDGTTESCLDTYYIYDNAGELLYIIAPKALTAIRNANASPWNVSLPAASTLIYSYIYDQMGRLTQKKVPGADWVYIVYDPLNRPVLAQDGILRAGGACKWMYFKYDNKDRVVSYGAYTDAVNGTGLTAMQSYVSGLSGTVYATYYYEEKQPGGTAPVFYTNRIFPTTNQNGSALQDLAYLYYDEYDFNDDGTADYSYTVQGLSGEATPTALTRGQLTGTFRKTLNNDGTLSVWLHNVIFYDKRGNTIQALSNNQTNTAAADTKTNVPDFIGKTLLTKVIKSVNSVTTTVSTTYGYDNFNRISTIDQANLQGSSGSSARIASYIYNELGQLVNKKLHSTDDVNFMQNVDYRYNINGLLSSINNATLTVDNTNYTNSDANDIFGEEILYDKSDATGLGNSSYYNGNISAVKWKAASSGNSNERSFVYAYDQLNRLLTAHYAEWSSGSSNWSQGAGYNDENVTKYDINGNIEALNRFANNTQIDQLSYTYSGNQLTNVTDGTNNTAGFNGTNSSAYVFDQSGNLTSDPKKGITVSYNVLNRTDKIQFSNGNYVRYTYDAMGTMIRKEAYNGSSTTTYDYIDGFIYQNLTLSYYMTPEGRVRNSSGTMTFEYFIRDHQGNVRVSFDGTGGTAVVRQENSFYPFGMTLPGNVLPGQPNNNLYNGGVEWQNDFGNMPDLYQTANRYYDAELGRFNSVDPYADMYHSMSPYQYALNNPIVNNDPSGALTQAEFDAALDEADWILNNPSIQNANITLVSNGEPQFDMSGGGGGGGDDGGGGDGGDYPNVIPYPLKNVQVAYAYYDTRGYTFITSDYHGETSTTLGEDWTYAGIYVGTPGNDVVDGVAAVVTAHQQSVAQYNAVHSDLSATSIAINGTDLIALNTIEKGSDFAAAAAGVKSFSSAKSFLQFGKTVSNISRYGVGGANIALTLVDGFTNPNGFQVHNGIDLVTGGLSIAFPVFGLIWGACDLVSQVTTGKSISEHIEEAIK